MVVVSKCVRTALAATRATVTMATTWIEMASTVQVRQ